MPATSSTSDASSPLLSRHGHASFGTVSNTTTVDNEGQQGSGAVEVSVPSRSATTAAATRKLPAAHLLLLVALVAAAVFAAILTATASGASASSSFGRNGACPLEQSPKHNIAYCNIPKAASSTLSTYMTGIEHDINNFPAVEQFIQDQGGNDHFDLVMKAECDVLAKKKEFRFFTVVRHPGTRLYSAWFDKIHDHKGADLPDMLRATCGSDAECTFETFVDGIISYLSSGVPNEHVDYQSRLCDPKRIKFQMIFKLEQGFDNLSKRLQKWTGVNFDFKATNGDTGYSHHTEGAEDVYAKFPVDDMEGYERLMPYDVQMKIYETYKRDFVAFGYPAPVKRTTQRASCPILPSTKD